MKVCPEIPPPETPELVRVPPPVLKEAEHVGFQVRVALVPDGFRPRLDVLVGRRLSPSDGRQRVAEVPADVDGPREFDSFFPDALDSREDDAPRRERNPRHVREDEFLSLVAGELSSGVAC